MSNPTEVLERLETERSELNTKLNALRNFITSTDYDELSAHHQALLKLQRDNMSAYERVLALRIDDLTAQIDEEQEG